MSKVSFIHISDTHLRGSKEFKLLGINTYNAARKALQAIKDSQLPYDFIIHTGDIASVDGTREEYEMSKELFSTVNHPIYFVTGNHDTASLMKELLKFGEHKDLSTDTNRLFYRFEIKDHLFVVLDSKATKELDPHGQLPTDHLEILNQLLKDTDKPVTIFNHFPTEVPNSAWLLDKMTILNQSDLKKVLYVHASKIKGVFSGHIHNGTVIVKDSILYSSVGSTCMQFRNNPQDDDVIFISSNIGFFNHVTVTENSVEIKEYSFVNDSGVFMKTRLEMTGKSA